MDFEPWGNCTTLFDQVVLKTVKQDQRDVFKRDNLRFSSLDPKGLGRSGARMSSLGKQNKTSTSEGKRAKFFSSVKKKFTNVS